MSRGGCVRLVSSAPPVLRGYSGFDACLVSDQGRFECHRVMLAAVSPILKLLLRERMDDDVTVLYLPEYSNTEIFLLNSLLTGRMFKQTNLETVPKLFKDLKIGFSNSYAVPMVKIESDSFGSTVTANGTSRSARCRPRTSSEEDCNNDNMDLCVKNSGQDSSGAGEDKLFQSLSREEFSDGEDVPNQNSVGQKVDKWEGNYSRRDDLKRHVNMAHEEEEGRIRERNKQDEAGTKDGRRENRCHLCEATVNTFRKHYKSKHRDGGTQLVKEYSKFLQFNSLEFQCNLCYKTFQSNKNLRIHTKSKHTEYTGTFSCEFCGRTFQQQITLKKHIFNFHGDLPVPAPGQGEERSSICDLCARVFDSEEDLKIHMWIHAKSLKCKMENCFQEFPRKTAYIEHMLLRHKVVIKVNKPRESKGLDTGCEEDRMESHLCAECGASFRTKVKLLNHCSSLHSKEFMCHVCNKVCKRKVALELHIAKHGPPNIKCEQCDKMFYTNYNMRRHIITMHVDNSQKPFKCSICPKGFESAKNLEGHLNMHNGLKPYICNLCGKGFQNASNRRAHLKKLHQLT